MDRTAASAAAAPKRKKNKWSSFSAVFSNLIFSISFRSGGWFVFLQWLLFVFFQWKKS
jgi:hypothetical protein